MIGERIFRGTLAMVPLLIGLIPFAVSTGIYGTDKGLEVWQSVTLSLIVFAGASQVAIIDLLSQSAPLWIIVITALLINLRFLVFSAALSPYVKKAPIFLRPYLAYTLVDQIFMLIADGRKTDKTYEWIGVASVTFFFWHISVFIGAYFGTIIPAYLSLEYALPIMFLFFGITMLKSRHHIITALSTGMAILILYPIMPLGSGLMTAIIIGAISGTLTKRIGR